VPNWCDNYFSVTHSDAAQLQRMQEAYARGELFQEFMPIEPKEDTIGSRDAKWETEGETKWDVICSRAAKWGTKWDVGGKDYDCDLVDNQLTMRFDTAWAPPLGFYEHLTSLGFSVIAYYYEPGMEFCGKWTSEEGDDSYEVDGDSAWVTDNIPADIDEHMGVSSQLANWEEEEQEETK